MRPEIKKEEDKAVQVEHEEKLHWYCFVFKTDEKVFNGSAGFDEKDKITLKDINNKKDYSLKEFNIKPETKAVLVNCFYLGYMTEKEFENS
jgi:hypothetical protein